MTVKRPIDTGDPYVNLALSVLLKARKANHEMWQSFLGEYSDEGNNYNPTIIAYWVGDYMWRKYHDIKEILA